MTIQVAEGRCEAILSGRVSDIPCPGLEGGQIGLYLTRAPAALKAIITDPGPLDWLAPGPAWRALRLSNPDGATTHSYTARDMSDWQTVQGRRQVAAGELRTLTDRAIIRREGEPLSADVSIEVRLRRPDAEAAVILFEPDSTDGWGFLLSGRTRRGSWWRWDAGGPSEPVGGIPFERSSLSHGQSLLRRILRVHQGALLLLILAWLAASILRKRPLPRLRPPSERQTVISATFLVFLFSILIAGRVLERMPHVQDSVTYLFQAQTLARGKLWAPPPPLPEFFEQEFLLVHNGRWFGKYPPGFPILLAVGVQLSQPWLINPVLATLTLPLLYRLGATLYGRPGPIGPSSPPSSAQWVHTWVTGHQASCTGLATSTPPCPLSSC